MKHKKNNVYLSEAKRCTIHAILGVYVHLFG